MKSTATAVALSLLCFPIPAQADLDFAARPMHIEGVSCVETTVTRVGYYYGNDPSSGMQIAFNTRLGVSRFHGLIAAVVDRGTYVARMVFPIHSQTGIGEWTISPTSDGAPNPIMLQERAGDRVQVCLVSVPTPEPEHCDPSKDPRGRMYRVYDYRLHASYIGLNAGHSCGGA